MSDSVANPAPARHEEARLAGRLLRWYDAHARDLPWRVPPARRKAGERPDPYRVWLSEIMLQQTTVAAVGPYFRAFTERWPSVQALAKAKREDVLAAWAGLGYYSRARNLHACALAVVQDHGGDFPQTEAGLRALPGIGAYTAAAIAAIAFDRPAVVVDGNVERVMARLFAVETPLPAAKPDLKALAALPTPEAPEGRPGDYAQAVMDLGATICTPRKPACVLCPWAEDCAARALGLAEALPRKSPKKPKPTRTGAAFWITRADGSVLLVTRADKGLLGGMIAPPSSAWEEGALDEAAVLAQAPKVAGANWRCLPGLVRHTFTHFHLELSVYAARVPERSAAKLARDLGGAWHDPDKAGLPTLMRKVAKLAQAAEDQGPLFQA